MHTTLHRQPGLATYLSLRRAIRAERRHDCVGHAGHHSGHHSDHHLAWAGIWPGFMSMAVATARPALPVAKRSGW
jgi:hypothetical protein